MSAPLAASAARTSTPDGARPSRELRPLQLAASAAGSTSRVGSVAASRSGSAASSHTENWVPPQDADGAYVRRTYAHFARQGVEDDGIADGKEWTRERGNGHAWEEPPPSRGSNHTYSSLSAPPSRAGRLAPHEAWTQRAPGSQRLSAPPVSPLLSPATIQTFGLSIVSPALSHPREFVHSPLTTPSPEVGFTPASPASSVKDRTPVLNEQHTFPSATSFSNISLARSDESVFSGHQRTPLSPGALAEEEEEEMDRVRSGKEAMLGEVDRYGFFSRGSDASSSGRPPRTTVLDSRLYDKLPGRVLLPALRPKHSRGRSSMGRKGADEPKSVVGHASSASLDGSQGSSTAELESARRARASSESAQRVRETSRVSKWQAMLRPDARDEGQNVRSYALANSLLGSKKLRRRVYKGVPDRWRAAAWWAMLPLKTRQDIEAFGAVNNPTAAIPSSEAQLSAEKRFESLAAVASPHDVQIDLDVPRTISGHVLFHTRYGQGQRSLFHVLHAFSLHCPDCAYCQGMGPIAATLLVYLPPERAYASLVALHDTPRYALHRTFSPGFPGLVENFYVQEQLCELFMPDLMANFRAHDISTSAYATKWYITLFANVVPFQTQIRLWDAMLLEGVDVLVAFALAILWAQRGRLAAKAAGFEVILGSLGAEFLPTDDDMLLRWVSQLLARDDVRRHMAAARKKWRALEASGEALQMIT